MPRHCCQKAFTLVELLVVISIIALLLAVLMPTLNKAREQGKKIVCGANLKQIGTLLELYAIDNKSKYVPAYSGYYHYGSCQGGTINGQNVEGSGLLLVLPYLYKQGIAAKDKNGIDRMKIFWCPSGKNKYDSEQWKGTAYANFGYNQYACQGAISCEWGSKMQKSLEHCPFKTIDKSAWITFADICFQGIGPVKSNHAKTYTKKIGSTTLAQTTAMGGNSLHVDGHVQWNSEKYLTDNKLNIKINVGDDVASTGLGRPAYWLYPRSN